MRPQFHFTARGWINDPHGVVFHNGAYHLFFQYVPDSTTWRLDCAWGHASGVDLFAWSEMPIALKPGDGDDGVWSGAVAVSTDGSARIFYTSVSAADPAMGRIRIATSSDPDLSSWSKGPVVVTAPLHAGIRAFRDPVVVADGAIVRMVVGAELDDGVAAAIGFSSADGDSWQSAGTVTSRATSQRDPVWSGSLWECPQIVELDGRHALIVSVWEANVLHDVVFALGTFEGGTFDAQQWGRLSFGPSPYAATTFRDETGHACVLFWLRNVSGPGWVGAHSIPYRMAVVDDRIALTPHPDLERYHRATTDDRSAVDIEWPAETEASLQVWNDGESILSIERNEHDLVVRVGHAEHRVPCSGDARIILDGPILEISSPSGLFASPMTAMDARSRVDAPGLTLRWLGKHARA